MFRNYFTVTIRNLFKNSVYSFINIAGLAIGITCSLLILLWVADELSFDKFHPKSDRLYQVWVRSEYDGKVNSWTSLPLPTYEAMKTADSKIVNSVVYDWGGRNHLISLNERRINKKAHYVSEEFLEMFQFPLLKGNAAQVLDDPSSIVITESTAKALFGDADPMNQTVRVDDKVDRKVTGVLKDIPKNSSFQFDFLLTWKGYRQIEPWVVRNETNWGNYSFQVSVELNDALSEADAESAIRDLLKKNGQTDIKRELFLHPLERWRLYSDFEDGKEGGMIDYVQMFSVIAVFILVIACINFMNLATARSERRAREVGIRKSVGSTRKELVFQFIGESLFISLLACVIAVLLAELTLPFYNDLVQKSLAIDYTSSTFWIFTIGLILVTGVVSGSYPAFYLSSFQPVKVLKGKVQVGKSASTPRKVLVTLQFGFSILLIIGTVVILQQIQLVKNRDLGYAQENLIALGYTDEIARNYKPLKEELLNSGVVASVTRSNSPVTNIYSSNFLGWPGKPEQQKVIFTTIATEYDYTKTMGIKVLEGRDFSEEFTSDTVAIIVNKAAMDIMQLKDPIGQQLDLWGMKRTLIGIVDNVLMGDPYAPVEPMFMILDPEWISFVSVRLEKTNDLNASISKVGEIFKKYNPAYPFEYQFADAEFGKKFDTINMTSDLATLFAVLTIVITGLGLFGLSAFTAEQRTKELGIRKVLGASVPGLIGLMNRDFSRLVLISFAISAPVAWWLLNTYLERYQYRITIAWWIFPLTGLVALIFAMLIVTTQAIKAARANPVNSLRNE